MKMQSLQLCVVTAVVVIASGCTSTSFVGTGTGRYLVQRDYGIPFSQVKLLDPQTCAQLRSRLGRNTVATGTNGLDCENIDEGENLPYTTTVSDDKEEAQLSTMTQSMCMAWKEAIRRVSPELKQSPSGCVANGSAIKGRRYFQVRDLSGKAYLQWDLSTESNCLKIEAARAKTYPSLPNVRHVCVEDSRSQEMQYVARIMTEAGLPVFEVEVVDKGYCEVMMKGTSLGSGYRSECMYRR